MADNTIAITAGAGTNVRTVTNAAVDGGAHQQVVGLADAAGNLLGTAAAPLPVVTTAATDTAVAATALAALNAAVSITLAGHSSVVIQATGTFSGTASFEGQMPDSAWVAVWAYNGFEGTKATAFFSSAGQARALVAGFKAFRVRVSAYTSGTLTVSLNASYGVAAPPTPANIAEASTFADTVIGTSVLGRTPGAGATAVSKVPITDLAGQLVASPLVQGLTVTNTTTVNATPGATGTIGHAAATITAAVTTAAAFIAAPAAGLSIYITDINVTNSGAAATLVSLFTAGSAVPLAAKYVAATTSAPPTSLRTPIRVGTATALNYTNSVASTSVFVQVTYYIAA